MPESYVRSGWEQPPEESREGHWRVFAARPFGENELVEVCPLVKARGPACPRSTGGNAGGAGWREGVLGRHAGGSLGWPREQPTHAPA